MKRKWFLASIAALAQSIALTQLAEAQDATTYGESLAAPIFEQIDVNGVDLISGSLRVSSPIMEVGQGDNVRRRGLTWTGKSWAIVEQPSIWRDGGKYIVMYRGMSDEFNDRKKNYSQRDPVNGAKLTCSIYEPGNMASWCTYTNRNGDVVQFKGRYAPQTPYPSDYGPSSYAWGNLGMTEASVYSADRSSGKYGNASPGALGESYFKNTEVTLTLGEQSLTIRTPNHTGKDSDQHYLRPKNTTQTISNKFGGTWSYTFNSDRFMTRMQPPGGADQTFISYKNGKVDTVTTAAGMWKYQYLDQSGDYGTTTVTDPYQRVTKVRYHHSGGYIVEHWNALNALTSYYYDDSRHLRTVTYPLLNRTEYNYDSRGNITDKVSYPKPSIGGEVQRVHLNYPATCSDPVICNQPTSIIDARSAQTDFEYYPSSKAIIIANYNQTVDINIGTNKPKRVTLPAPASNRARPETRNVYAGGLLTRSSTCISTQSCEGTSDEIVTDYSYSGRDVVGITISNNGTLRRTCFGYDTNGRKVSETSPRSEQASCPFTLSNPSAITSTMPDTGQSPSVPVFPDTVSAAPSPSDPDYPNEPACGVKVGYYCP